MQKLAVVCITLLAVTEVANCLRKGNSAQDPAATIDPTTVLQAILPPGMAMPTQAQIDELMHPKQSTLDQISAGIKNATIEPDTAREAYPPKPPTPELRFVGRGKKQAKVYSFDVVSFELDLFVKDTCDVWKPDITEDDLIAKAPGNAALTYHFRQARTAETMSTIAQIFVSDMNKLGCEDMDAAGKFSKAWEKYADGASQKVLTLNLGAHGIDFIGTSGLALTQIESDKISKCLLLWYLHKEAPDEELRKPWMTALRSTPQSATGSSQSATGSLNKSRGRGRGKGKKGKK
jgi:hypothetical protein